MNLRKVIHELQLSATQITRLAEDNKIVRYHKKDRDTKSWEYDDESVYAYKQYLKEKAALDQRYNNIKTVIKRDRSVATFDTNKIKNAVEKAFADVYQSPADYSLIVDKVVDLAVNKLLRQNRNQFDITEIQTAVEQSLVDAEQFDVAKAYTEYRLNHDIARKQ